MTKHKATIVELGKHISMDVDKLIAGRALIQANSGGGKSYTVRKVAEITYGYVQQIIIDVDGEYHTLRERHDYMLFGKDGDYPADIKGAALLARRLLETRVSAIIDIYELGTRKDLFVQKFLEALISAPRELWHQVLVFVDEAHKFAPEGGKSVARAAVEDLMTLGRKRGYAGVLATQRISKLSKTAAAECNNKLIGRAALDIDRKRCADEIGLVGRDEIRSLRALTEGQFYAIGPSFINDDIDTNNGLIQIGKAKTTHLSAGQTRSVKPVQPSAKIKKLFSQFSDIPAEVDQEVKTTAELRAQVQELTAQLAKAPKVETKTETKTEIKTIEKPVIKSAELKRLEALLERALKISTTFGETLPKMVAPAIALAKQPALQSTVRPPPPVQTERPVDRKLREANQQLAANQRAIRAGGETTLKGGPAQVLSILIQHVNGCTSQQIAVLTGYKATSRYEFGRQLIAQGYADSRGDRLFATDAGRAAMPNVQPLPKGDALRQLAIDRQVGGERKIFELILEAYPNHITPESLQEQTGYKGTSVYEFTRKLVAQELVVKDRSGLRASDNLYT